MEAEAQAEVQAGSAATPPAPPPAPVAAPASEPKEVNVQIKMPYSAYQRLKKCADYAAASDLIVGHHLGNVTAYMDFCVRLGEEAMRQHEMKARGL